jgi:hypothetical protein
MHSLPPRKTTKNKKTNQQRKSKRQAIRQSVIQSVNEPDKKKKREKIVANTNTFLPLSTTGAIRGRNWKIGPRVETSTVGVPALAP